MKNNVIFKANQNGIVIVLADNIPFETLKNELKEKLKDAKNFFDNSKTNISFKGANLKENEELELIDIISNTTNLNISFVGKEFLKQKEVKVPIIEQAKEVTSDTLVHRGSLRSGQYINHKGNVVLIGSLNPGAKITASGHIIVLGSLKGVVHAGCDGDTSSFIASLNLMSSQLRIFNFITCIPKNSTQLYPSLAYIQDNQIYIEPLV